MGEQETVSIGGFADIPEPGKVEFAFRQNGQKYVLEFYPLTADEVERIRTSFSDPEPPTRALEGKSAQQLAILAHQGAATTYKDYNDPEYQTALNKREADISLEMVRVALRWGSTPDGRKPDETLLKVREEFGQEMRRRLTAGNYGNLIQAVTRASFALDQRLIENF